MTRTLKNIIEHYFGDIFDSFNFHVIHSEEQSRIIYQSGACRLRFTKHQMDTDIEIGGTDASLEEYADKGWISLPSFLDFMDDKRSVDHLFRWSSTHTFEEFMMEMMQRLTAHMPMVLSWFEPMEAAQHLAQYEAFRHWRLAEIKRVRRKGQSQ